MGFVEAPASAGGRRLRYRARMDLTTTLAIALGLAAFGLFAGWRGARPFDPRRGPRMLPWRFLMLLAAAGVILMIVHVVNLLGVTTGR